MIIDQQFQSRIDGDGTLQVTGEGVVIDNLANNFSGIWEVTGGSTLVYFACEDCAVEAPRAAAYGGQLFKPKMPIGEHGFIAMVVDTEGNMIGLHSATA